MTDSPTFLTAAEVAKQIRMDVDYVTRVCRAGSLRATKLGSVWRITQDAVDDFMGGGKVPASRDRRSRRQKKRAA